MAYNRNVALDKAAILLNAVGDNAKFTQLEVIIEMVEADVLNYINCPEIPDGLEATIIELVIARFGRVGFEGLTSHSIEGVSVQYEQLLQSKYPILNKFKRVRTI